MHPQPPPRLDPHRPGELRRPEERIDLRGSRFTAERNDLISDGPHELDDVAVRVNDRMREGGADSGELGGVEGPAARCR